MPESPKLLLIEDDSAFRRLYLPLLREAGWEVVEAADRPAARAALAAASFEVVLLDLMLPPDGSVAGGVAQLEEIVGTYPATKVIVASGVGDTRAMLQAVRGGAYDFLTKPVDPDVLLVVVQRALARVRLERELAQLRASLEQSASRAALVGESPSFRAAVSLAERVAGSDLPVLVTGENGTGKELFARLVHQASRRAQGPFVAVNCGALTESLLESALFGHRKGAFTGAHRDRAGLFMEANGGTLFLDEIGDMPASLQVKVLRAIEYGDILPVGADATEHVDVRIVSATNRDLLAMQKAGAFREDLYWRIKGAEVRLPALRERLDDLALLARHFLNQCGPLAADGRPKLLSDSAVEALRGHPWSGNLRELRHEMQRATVLAATRREILAEDLSYSGEERVSSANAPGTLAQKVDALERREIEEALKRSHGNRTHAAGTLGISRQGLLKKLERLGLV